MKSSTGLLTLMCDVHNDQQSQSNNRKYPSQSLTESKSIAQICTHKHISMQSVTLMHTPIRATEMGRPFSSFKYMIGHYFSNSIV